MQTVMVKKQGMLKEMERKAIIETLEKHGGNRTHAARELGIGLRTLQRRLLKWKKEGING